MKCVLKIDAKSNKNTPVYNAQCKINILHNLIGVAEDTLGNALWRNYTDKDD